MTLSRRSFVAGSGAALVSVGLSGCQDGDGDGDGERGAPTNAPGEPPFDPADWASVRAQFALSTDVAHFAAFTLAAHPRPVAEAIARHRRGLDESSHGYLFAEQAASVTPYRQPYLRFGPSIVTDPEQVDTVVAAIAAAV